MYRLTEKQALKHNRPISILMAVIMVPILILIAVQVIRNPENTEAFYALLLIMGSTVLAFLLIFRMSTHLVLEKQQIRFREWPFSRKLNSLKLSEIASLKISKHKWWQGYGYRYSFSGDKIMAMKPGKVLMVETKNGKKYHFGINREAQVRKFIEEEWPNIPFDGR